MITLFTWKEFYGSPAKTLLKLQCEYCGKIFEREKRRIQSAMNNKTKDKCNFCSRKCNGQSKNKYITITCTFCNKEFLRKPYRKMQLENFCSKKCSSKYRISQKSKKDI